MKKQKSNYLKMNDLHNDFMKDVFKYFENMKPILKRELEIRLTEKACKELDYEEIRKRIEAYIKENTDLLKPEKHIEVYVHASDEQTKESKMTVSFIALDDYGAEAIRKMKEMED